MDKIIKRINSMKEDKNSYFEYIKCFINNDKANELFVNNKTFKSIKSYMNNRKY